MAPERIVSLVPSLTELVWWLGCGDALCGRTRFCEEPAGEIEVVPAIGGTKNPDVAAITALAPDLVIANREENRREDVEALRDAGLHVLLTDPNSVEEALAMIVELGEALGREAEAEGLVGEVRAAVEEGGRGAADGAVRAHLAEPADGPGGGYLRRLGAGSGGRDERTGGADTLPGGDAGGGRGAEAGSDPAAG